MNQVSRFFAMPVVMALLWLAASIIVAWIVRALVVGVFRRSGFKGRLTRDSVSAQEGERAYQTSLDYVGRLTFLLVFLMFVPAIFTSLGVETVSGPVMVMLNNVWGFIPNILAAGIVLAVGFMAARLVRHLLVPVFARVQVDKLQQRAGIRVRDDNRLSQTLASVIYVLIVVPSIIVALQVLDIEAISVPATNMLNTVIGFVPNVVAASVLVMLGVLLARIGGSVVGQLVASTGIDAKLDDMYTDKPTGIQVSKVANYAVQTVVTVLAVVESFEVLELEVLTGIGASVVAYLPNIFAAALVFILAGLASRVVGRSGSHALPLPYARLVQVAIWAFTAIMVFSQLNIAPAIVQGGSAIVLGAVAVAFALSFGIGGRDAAKRLLDNWADSMSSAQEIGESARRRQYR